MEQREVIEVQPHELLMGLAEVIRETQRNIGYYEMKRCQSHTLIRLLMLLCKEKRKS